jgi:FkbM family methyltransferase
MRTIYGFIELHSQPATRQDEWVIKHTRGLRDGYFIECGSYDGLRHSNTLALERSFRWKGLLVEADPYSMNLTRANRPICKHCEAALSVTTNSTVRFTQGGQWGGLTTWLPDAWKREARDRNSPEIWVKSITLYDLLDRYQCPTIINYFSLDVEGAEFSILREYFHGTHRHRFRCLTVEYREDTGELMRLRRLLEPHGYVLDRTRAWDAFFYHEDLVL